MLEMQPPPRPGTFVEYETWTIRPGLEDQHHDMIRTWFHFVREHHDTLFAEWKSMRYYRQVDRDGAPVGRYIMLFEFHTLEGHHAYKERRKDYSGPYVAYGKIDPYQFFIVESVTTDYWEPQETHALGRVRAPRGVTASPANRRPRQRPPTVPTVGPQW